MTFLLGCKNEFKIKKAHSRAGSAMEEKKYNKAIEYLNQSLEYNYFNYYSDLAFKSYETRGLNYYYLKKYSEAIVDFSSALKINNDSKFCYSFRASAKRENGNMDGACLDWKKAAELGDIDAAKWVDFECN